MAAPQPIKKEGEELRMTIRPFHFEYANLWVSLHAFGGQNDSDTWYETEVFFYQHATVMKTLVTHNARAVKNWIDLIQEDYEQRASYIVMQLECASKNAQTSAIIMQNSEYCMIYQPGYDVSGVCKVLRDFLSSKTFYGINLRSQLQKFYDDYGLDWTLTDDIHDISDFASRTDYKGDGSLDDMSKYFLDILPAMPIVESEGWNAFPLHNMHVMCGTVRAAVCSSIVKSIFYYLPQNARYL